LSGIIRLFSSLVFGNIVVFLFLLLLIMVPFSSMYLDDMERVMREGVKTRLEMASDMGALLIDGGSVIRVNSMIWYDTPEYEGLVQSLGEIKKRYDLDVALLLKLGAAGEITHLADGNRRYAIGARLGPDLLPRDWPGILAQAAKENKPGTGLYSPAQKGGEFQLARPLVFKGRVAAALVLKRDAATLEEAVSARKNRLIIGLSLALLGGVFIWWALGARRIRPLLRLAEASREVAAGNLEVELPSGAGRSEVGILGTAFGSMVDSLKAGRQAAEQGIKPGGAPPATELENEGARLMENNQNDASLGADGISGMEAALENIRLMVRAWAGAHGRNVELKEDISSQAREMMRGELLETAEPILAHIVYNALEHGIEQPWIRAGQGKPETSGIALEARVEKQGVYFAVKDDGRGLELENVRRGMVEQGRFSRDEAELIGRRELLRMLFEEQLSGAARQRGGERRITLPAIRKKVESRGGWLRLTTRSGKGTTFEMFLPGS